MKVSRTTQQHYSCHRPRLAHPVKHMQNFTDVHFQELPDDYFDAVTRRHKADTHFSE